mgnify:FL=1
MVKKSLYLCILLALGLLWAIPSSAQEAQLTTVSFPKAAAFTSLSDNGLWATAAGVNDDDPSKYAYPYLINVETGALTELWVAADLMKSLEASDVTNDGKIIVGTYDSKPAYYDMNQGKWVTLQSENPGKATSVTPDGKYIGGWSNSDNSFGDAYVETPLLWEKQSDGTYRAIDVYAELPNFPKKTKLGTNTQQVRIDNISPDGNIIAGIINFVTPATVCYYVYNKTTQECKYVDNALGEVPDETFVDESTMSNNGKYLTGIVQVAGGSYLSSYLYNTSDNSCILYNAESEEQDRDGSAVSNSGVVFGCSPAVNPVRSAYVRVGNLWYGIDEILSGRYGINFYERTGYDITGFIQGVSDDEKTMIGMSETKTTGYIIRLPETISEAASSVNPLSTYAVSPVAGSKFAKFSQMKLAFSKSAAVTSGVKAQFMDASGKVLREYNITAQSGNKTFTIGGIPQALNADEEYTMKIPAGAFYLMADNSIKSEEITVKYIGRAEAPAAVQQVSPADQANVSEISSEHPVQILFDLSIAISEDAKAYLYKDGQTSPICELNFVQGAESTILLYPSLKRYLEKDEKYKVVVEAGSVTDIMGFCANNEITINYTGAYEPEISSDGSLFSDDFNDPGNSMVRYLLYEGDHNKPSSAMQDLGFDVDNSPWLFVIRESESSSDYCAASTSIYNPTGKSDDWMAIPRLSIENADYYLSFDVQSYYKSKADRLKVLVLEDDAVYSNFTKELYDKFKANGKVIYDEQLTPGESEEGLSGDWTHVEKSLAEYAGKNIYIAFVNENDNQSMIFLDNLKVYYKADFNFAPNVQNTQINKESTTVGAVVKVTSDKTYNSISATLTSEDGSFKSTYTDTPSKPITSAENYSFTFPDKMPLKVGEQNKYTISIDLGGTVYSQTNTISNLAYETTKHVVIEEATGTWCVNCPRGILAMEYLESIYGDLIIPITIHSSSESGSDPFNYSKYTSALGLNAFPSGLVNRIDTVYSPTSIDANQLYHFDSEDGNQTFYDIAKREFNSYAIADVAIDKAIYDVNNKTVQISGNVNYALNMNSLNHNIAFVVLEDGLVDYQANGHYGSTDPLLGKFGKGGEYGTATPKITFVDVARKVPNDNFAGESGFIPVSVTAGQPVAFNKVFSLPENVTNWDNAKVVVMLIDANTERVLNAAKLKMSAGTAGINDATVSENGITISGENGSISVNGGSDLNVTVYDVSGSVISNANSTSGAVKVSTGGKNGLFIVKATSDGVSVVKKVIVK